MATMIREDLMSRSFHQLLARLELVSHAPTLNLAPTRGPASDEDIGGKRPPGTDRERPNRRDADEVAAFLESYHRKTVYYFRSKHGRANSPEARAALKGELVDTLLAWMIAPIPKGDAPAYGTSAWKRYIAGSKESTQTLADRFNCSTRYINRIRRQEGLVVREVVDPKHLEAA